MSETPVVTLLFLVFWIAILIQLTALPIFQSTRLAKCLGISDPGYPFLVTIFSVTLILLMRLIHIGWLGILFMPLTMVDGLIYTVTTVRSRKLVYNKSLINQLIITNIIFLLAVGLQFDASDGPVWLVCGINIHDALLQHYLAKHGISWNTLTLLVHFGLWMQLRMKLKTSRS